MGKYAREPDNAAKSCKSRGSHLRVHFKVSISVQASIFRQCFFLVRSCQKSRMCNVFTVDLTSELSEKDFNHSTAFNDNYIQTLTMLKF